jgi:hypothetical protein
MRKVNSFVKINLNKIYIGIFLLFWVLILSACEKEPITPFEKPSAVDPTDIAGTWDITKFYMLEEGFRLDVSAWVEYVNDSTFDIGTIEFNGIAEFDLIYGTRAEGYPSNMRWGNNHNSTLQDSSTLGWNWKAEKPLCNTTPFEYIYVPATYFLGLDNEEWITTYKTTNKWILENVRRYDNQLQLTGEHYQYREITLER